MERFYDDKKYDTVTINGNPYLFAEAYIDRETVPEGYVAYDVAAPELRYAFWLICKDFGEANNYYGTIIGKAELPLDEDGEYMPPYGSEEYEGAYGSAMTLSQYEEYLEGYDPAQHMEPHKVIDGKYSLIEGHEYLLSFTMNEQVEKNYDMKVFDDIMCLALEDEGLSVNSVLTKVKEMEFGVKCRYDKDIQLLLSCLTETTDIDWDGLLDVYAITQEEDQ